VDVKEAKNGNRYLSISESRIDSEQKKQRVTVRVFGDSIADFCKAIDEVAESAG